MDEMGWAYGTHGSGVNTKFWSTTEKEKRYLENLGVDGRIMDLKEVGCDGVDCIHLAQDNRLL